MSSPVDPDSLRISAAERDAAVAAIGEHLAAGRLELDEYERRVNAATQARTYADLRPLFVDLPQPHPPPTLTAHTGPGHLPAEVRDKLTAEGLRVGAFDHDRSGRIAWRLQTREAKTIAGMLATTR